jgi:hypothetical protein
MVWYNPFSWGASTPEQTQAVSTTPPPTADPYTTGARRRRTRHGRKGSKRYQSKRARTGRKSIRS